MANRGREISFVHLIGKVLIISVLRVFNPRGRTFVDVFLRNFSGSRFLSIGKRKISFIKNGVDIKCLLNNGYIYGAPT